MNKTAKMIVVTALAATVVGAVALKTSKPLTGPEATAPPAATVSAPPAEGSRVAAKPLPKLVDLGAGKCIPCRMMAPILEALKKEYAGRLEVTFIDVWQNPDAGKQFGVEAIPTQIFYDAGGKELFRHLGFFGMEDILAKWKELGEDLTGKPKSGMPVRKDAAVGTNSAAKEPISESTPGIMVDSLIEMDALFGDMHAVFLLIPATNGLSSVNWVPVNRAKLTLEAEWDVDLGLFELKPGSRDYNQIAKRESVEGRPAVMVILRNGTVSVLSRELTESNLVQEFIYAVSTGGCCPLGDQ